MISYDATAAGAACRMHAGERCAIEIALSFQSVFGYRRSLVGLSTEVDALARSGPDLVAFLAFPTDRPRFPSVVRRSEFKMGRVAFAQEFSGGQEALRWQSIVWGQ